MTAIGTSSEQVWYLVFCDDDEEIPRWWNRFLKKGFRHAYCFAQNGLCVTVIEPLYHTVQVENYFPEDDPHGVLLAEFCACAWSETYPHVLECQINVDERGSIRSIFNAFPTCVSLLKTVVGIKGFAITPYQLYKLALRQGAVEITPTERRRRLMGFAKPKRAAPVVQDTKKQEAKLKKEEDEAKAESQAAAVETQKSLTDRRRKQRGRLSLIASEGGELGVTTQFGT